MYVKLCVPQNTVFLRGDTVFAAFYDRLESMRDFFSTQLDRQARMQQFAVALSVRTFKDFRSVLSFWVIV